MPNKPWLILVVSAIFLVVASISLIFISLYIREYVMEPTKFNANTSQYVGENVQLPAADETNSGRSMNDKKVAAVTAKSVQPIWPVEKNSLMQTYGWQQHPVFHDWRYHQGIDIAASSGTKVKAVMPGVVKKVDRDDQYSYTVCIHHLDWTASYSSLASSMVKEGDTINQGTIIGIVGKSELEPYEHLHFGIMQGDKTIDPLEKLP